MSKDNELEEVNSQGVNRRQFLMTAALGAGAVALNGTIAASETGPAAHKAPASNQTASIHASSSAWKFGVLADTQWITKDDGVDPNSVAVDIINQINEEFIQHKVKFVVQVGDLCDKGTTAGLCTRALYSQALYNAGIGFYPLRGNHESKQANAQDFILIWPQTQTGMHNTSPTGVFNVDGLDAKAPTPSGSPFRVGKILGSPDPDGTGNLNGLSYALDFNNARFILLDQFDPLDGGTASSPYSINLTIGKQQSWITSQLSSRPAGTHAFVFGHKGLITENHVDTLFGEDPTENAPQQDAFIKSLFENNARYYIHGHDHMHDRSIITTTDGSTAKVMQLLCSSDSSKFYIPSVPSNDNLYNEPAAPGGFGRLRQTPISQELNTIGFYIFTVDGPQVSVDFYSADVYPALRRKEYVLSSTPTLNFIKRETFGSSLNGQEFLVAPGEPYTTVQDKSPAGTKARILAGINGRSETDGSNRPCSNAVNTGWASSTKHTVSDILTLSGMARNLGSDQTDVYTLSMSYIPGHDVGNQLKSGAFGLATADVHGNWIKASNGKFVLGPWNSKYALGTCGVDDKTNTAWAVINYNGVFAVANI
jgi:hypothetical protein